MFAYCLNNPVNYNDADGDRPVFTVVCEERSYHTSVSNNQIDLDNEIINQTNSVTPPRPYEWNPNSRFEAENGDWRDYGEDGKPMVDYDHDDHGNPKNHPHDENGGHYHDWVDGKRGKARLAESYAGRKGFGSEQAFGVAVDLGLSSGLLIGGFGCSMGRWDSVYVIVVEFH